MTAPFVQSLCLKYQIVMLLFLQPRRRQRVVDGEQALVVFGAGRAAFEMRPHAGDLPVGVGVL